MSGVLTGVFGEVDSEEEHLEQVQKNTRLVYEFGIFNSFVELLGMELE